MANRIAKIHEMIDRQQWRHVDTPRNPADGGSRGKHAKYLTRWLKGPEFLLEGEDVWPTDPVISEKKGLPDLDLQEDHEVKKTHVYTSTSSGVMDDLMTTNSSWNCL